MSHWLSRLKRLARHLTLGLLYLGVAHAVFTCYAVDPPTDSDPRFTFEKMISGEADRPFVYRTLVPWTVRQGSRMLTPAAFRLYEKYRWPEKIEAELRHVRLERSLVREWTVFSWLCTGLFAVFGLSLHGLIRHIYALDVMRSHAFSLVAMSLVTLFFDKYNQLYDPASLALFPLATLMFLRGHLVAYYLVLCLAILNKETALLLPCLFGVWFWGRRPSRFVAAHVAAQLGLYLGLTLTVRALFQQNPGTALERQFLSNLTYASTPSIHLLLGMLKLSGMAVMVSSGWSRKPEPLRRGLLLVLAVLGPLWLLFGRLQEIRVFYEAWFLICLLALPAFFAPRVSPDTQI
jgi:hypothetical protein